MSDPITALAILGALAYVVVAAMVCNYAARHSTQEAGQAVDWPWMLRKGGHRGEHVG